MTCGPFHWERCRGERTDFCPERSTLRISPTGPQPKHTRVNPPRSPLLALRPAKPTAHLLRLVCHCIIVGHRRQSTSTAILPLQALVASFHGSLALCRADGKTIIPCMPSPSKLRLVQATLPAPCVVDIEILLISILVSPGPSLGGIRGQTRLMLWQGWQGGGIPTTANNALVRATRHAVSVKFSNFSVALTRGGGGGAFWVSISFRPFPKGALGPVRLLTSFSLFLVICMCYVLC